MKWLDKIIQRIAVETFNSLIAPYTQVIGRLEDENRELKEKIYLVEEINKKNDEVHLRNESEFLDIVNKLDDITHRFKNINFKVDENDKSLREGMAGCFNELTVKIDNKLSHESELFDKKINESNERIKFLEELKDRLDDGIILMTKQQLLKLMEQKIEVFEGNLNSKMSGLMIYVNEQVTQASNGKISNIEILKKLAKLEGIREDIIMKRNELLNSDSKTAELLDSILGDNHVIK